MSSLYPTHFGCCSKRRLVGTLPPPQAKNPEFFDKYGPKIFEKLVWSPTGVYGRMGPPPPFPKIGEMKGGGGLVRTYFWHFSRYSKNLNLEETGVLCVLPPLIVLNLSYLPRVNKK